MNRVELLSPAGNYETFLAAVKAGCNAVYLGGNKYSARAYADNFSDDEIRKAILYAHLFSVKVYMAVNTLCKEQELDDLINYMTPFYESGLDGVIIQDIGVLLKIKENFPGLELHASTQMTITGTYHAEFLKSIGVSRIVPARELSLKEIKKIKENTGLEIEAFIHGAMCYCYSGSCLFSSILGGRSGNRGRCAQPCRLPYKICTDKTSSAEEYPLSLKDMCTINLIPDLIEAGIDSFKIEGRMKKAEYCAGVTAIYRKYIDLYYRVGREGYHVSKEDMNKLSNLYIRSDIQDGYYYKHNGAEMITLKNPAYKGCDDYLLEQIKKEFIDTSLKKDIQISACFHKDSPVSLTITSSDLNHEPISVTIQGDICMKAEKQPVTKENIVKGLSKLGNTDYTVKEEHISIEMDEDVFFPLKSINELRREGIEALQNIILQSTFRQKVNSIKVTIKKVSHETTENRDYTKYHVFVTTKAQLNSLKSFEDDISTIYLDSLLWSTEEFVLPKFTNGIKCYLAFPFIIREKDYPELERNYSIIEKSDGCLVRNVEAYQWLLTHNYSGQIRTDTSVYCFNPTSLLFWQSRAEEICLPLELNDKEKNHLMKNAKNSMEELVYGRIPLMITANCISKTSGICKTGHSGIDLSYYLEDRYKKDFPVLCNCKYCYNIIYNSVPLLLPEKALNNDNRTERRIDFTIESINEVKQIMDYFCKGKHNIQITNPLKNYTRGHEKRGVE